MSLHNGLICVLKCDQGHSHLVVHIKCVRTPTTLGVVFNLNGHGLPPGKKGFHIHQTGDLTDGCASLGAHYNPTGVDHGGLNELYAHLGDLGNVTVDSRGRCHMQIRSHLLTLAELVGRSIVLHSNKDDLGRGGNPESLKTGNSGARICCGVIGFAQDNLDKQ